MNRSARHLVLCLFAVLQCLLPLLHAHAAEDQAHMTQHGVHLDGVEVDGAVPSLLAAAHDHAGVGVGLALAARPCHMSGRQPDIQPVPPGVLPAGPPPSHALEHGRCSSSLAGIPSPPLAERPLVPYPCAPPRA